MIKWCSYCQHFMHEAEPFGRYVISHGICEACIPGGREFGEAERRAADELAAFFHSLQETARGGTPDDRRRILAESRRLGIRPIDLMMGMLQPLLREIGELWAAGAVTVGCEHRFADLVGDLMTHFRAPSAAPAPGAPLDLLLLPARDNTHTLGLRMAEAYLASTGLTVLTLLRGIATPELIELVEFHQPRGVGFSVAMPDQVAQVAKVAEAMKHLRFPPRQVFLGGPAIRPDSLLPAPPPSLTVARDVRDLRDLPGLLQGAAR